MIRAAATVAVISTALSCSSDETLSGYGAADTTWRLVSVNGAPFEAEATLTFPEEGRVQGEAPCNQFSGAQLAPYPWFQVDRLAVTRRACPELDAEAVFFEALSAMTLAEVAGDTLLLSNDDGKEMLFRAGTD